MGEVVILKRPEPPTPDADLVFEAWVYSDSEGTIWLSDYFQTPEQFNWLSTKILEIGATLNRLKAERTGTL